MKRRTLLTAVAMSSTGFAGCVGDSDEDIGEADEDGSNGATVEGDESDENRTEPPDIESECGNVGPDEVTYERCDNRIVRVIDLPERAECEARAVIDADQCGTADDLLLPSVINIESSYLRYEGMYYAVEVTEEEAPKTLCLTERRPTFQDAVTLENRRNDDVTVRVRIESEETDAAIFDSELEFDAGEVVRLDEEATFTYGVYHATLEGDDLPEDGAWELTWELNYAFETGDGYPLELDDHGLFEDPVSRNHTYGPCTWDEEGQVTTGD